MNALSQHKQEVRMVFGEYSLVGFRFQSHAA